MTTLKIVKDHSQIYCYTECKCGRLQRITDDMLTPYILERNYQRISLNTKRGIDAARKRGIQIGRPSKSEARK